MSWLPINTQIRQTLPFKLTSTFLELQDRLINFDEITEEEDESIFQVEPLPVRSYEKQDTDV